MRSLATLLVAATMIPSQATADIFGAGANQFEIMFVTIGNPGNPPDATGNPNPAGSVAYVYRMGKFEVSRDMVEKANVEGGLGLELHPMDLVTGGPRPEMPATGVNWNNAARFTNWLNTSLGFPPAYKFSTQPGEGGYDADANIELWVDSDLGFNAANPFRNSLARYVLPSVNEWYKAAYYDPTANGGTGRYWHHSTGSDTPPTPVARGTDPHTAVYGQSFEQGPADIMHAGDLSPYGVMGLDGNVWEWEETEVDLMNDDGSSERGLRGGEWNAGGFFSASSRGDDYPTYGLVHTGFRVASIPEPSSLLLGAVAAVISSVQRRASKKSNRNHRRHGESSATVTDCLGDVHQQASS